MFPRLPFNGMRGHAHAFFNDNAVQASITCQPPFHADPPFAAARAPHVYA